jgi:hypothetical protein
MGLQEVMMNMADDCRLDLSVLATPYEHQDWIWSDRTQDATREARSLVDGLLSWKELGSTSGLPLDGRGSLDKKIDMKSIWRETLLEIHLDSH